MKKTLLVLAVICLAMSAAAWAADVTNTWEPTKDAGIDGSYAEHTNRGGDYKFRFAKGHGEFGMFDFDRAAIRTWVNSNLGGQTLQQAINLGKIKVEFSLVCATDTTQPGNDPNAPVQVTDVWSSDNWSEGDGIAATDAGGNDLMYNWTGALVAPYSAHTAITRDAPSDYFGLATGPGGGNWNGRFADGVQHTFQQLPQIAGTINSVDMNGWALQTRTTVQLDDVLWAEYIFGVQANDVTQPAYATCALRTWGYDTANNLKCGSKEDDSISHRPHLSITITQGQLPPAKHPGDANNDGAVDVVDLGILARNYDGTGKTWAEADFNADTAVDVVDLGILARNYDWTGAPAGAVPEPMTLSLLGLGAAALLRRRGYAG